LVNSKNTLLLVVVRVSLHSETLTFFNFFIFPFIHTFAALSKNKNEE